MCLSVREQQQLDTIGEAVRESDAQLASMLATFGRLTAGDPMPDREPIHRPARPHGPPAPAEPDRQHHAV